MKILIIIIFILCLIPAGAGAVTTVTGYRGGSVQIRCNYTAGYEENRKYLCRGSCSTLILNINKIVESGSDPEDKRFSLYDNTADKVFIITITDLRAEDEDTYWCGIDQFGIDHYTRVDLLVKTAGAGAVTTVTGYRGGSVQIRCNYTAGSEKDTKYLCRSYFTPSDEMKDILVQSGSDPEDKRFSLYDNTADKVFIITITDLRPEDEGTYWCGIDKPGINHYTEVKLRVKTDDSARIPLTPSTCFPSSHTVSTSVPGASTPLTTGSTIILVLVIVTLLLIGLVLLIVFLQRIKRRKKHGVSLPCVSEGTEDTGRCSEAVYSNLEPLTHTSSSNKNVFAMAQVDTVPCDSTHAAADRPSNSPDEDFYSTAQLPADPSASSEKPDEGLIYTQIKFNVAYPTDFKKEDDSCEYSTVAAVPAMSPK